MADLKDLLSQEGTEVVLDFGDRSLTFDKATLGASGAGDFDFV